MVRLMIRGAALATVIYAGPRQAVAWLSPDLRDMRRNGVSGRQAGVPGWGWRRGGTIAGAESPGNLGSESLEGEISERWPKVHYAVERRYGETGAKKAGHLQP